jgi:polyhydroxyalkanoate synthase
MVNTMLDLVLDAQASAYGQTLRTWQRLWNAPRVLELARDNRALPTPHETVYEQDTFRLLHYPRAAPAAYAEPVLICSALVSRPSILDLQGDRSVVRQFLGRGFEVYLIDWGAPSPADRSTTLADSITGRMRAAAGYVVRHAPTAGFHLVGYCLGGTMSAIFAAVWPELVKTLVLMAAPIDFSGQEGLLRTWTDPKYFDVDALVDAFGNCPAPLLRGMCRMLTPVQSYVGKYLSAYDRMDDERFLRNYVATERWAHDSLPVAGATFRELVKRFYQGNELVEGRYTLGDVPVVLRRITCPVLLLTARGDHLVPPAQTEGLRPRVGSGDVTAMSLDAGHVGLAASTKAHTRFWPAATAWLADRSTPAGA